MPNRFTPINTRRDIRTALRQINDNFRQLDNETYSKNIVAGGGKKVMSSGKLSTGRYGFQLNDPDNGMPNILLGFAPNDGRPGLWITKKGFNVEDEIG